MMTTRPYSLRFREGTTVAVRYMCGCERDATVEAGSAVVEVLRLVATTRGRLCPEHDGSAAGTIAS